MQNIKIIQEFILSSIIGSSTTLLYIFTSKYLDSYIDINISNFIGLLLDNILDYILQQYVFIGYFSINNSIIIRFIIGKIICIVIPQVLFYILSRQQLGISITILRTCIAILTFCFVTFPIRKYYIYQKNNDTNKTNKTNKNNKTK